MFVHLAAANPVVAGDAIARDAVGSSGARIAGWTLDWKHTGVGFAAVLRVSAVLCRWVVRQPRRPGEMALLTRPRRVPDVSYCELCSNDGYQGQRF